MLLLTSLSQNRLGDWANTVSLATSLLSLAKVPTMMRLIFFMLICAVLNSQIALAEPEDKNLLPPAKSEKELVMRIVNSLKAKDSVLHASQFMKFDDLWKLVVNFKDTNIVASMQVAQLRQVPNTVRKFDPFFNPQIGHDFN